MAAASPPTIERTGIRGFGGYPLRISADGRIAVGTRGFGPNIENPSTPWFCPLDVQPYTSTDLPIPPGFFRGVATGVTADGSTAIGSLDHIYSGAGIRWRLTDGSYQTTPPPPDYTSVQFTGCSADGQVVVGVAGRFEWPSLTAQDPVRWTSAGTEVIPLPANQAASLPVVSADGNVLASGGTLGAYRWTRATGWVPIPLSEQLVGRSINSIEITGISQDGSVMIGIVHLSNYDSVGVRWSHGGSVAEVATAGWCPSPGPASYLWSLTPDGTRMLGQSQYSRAAYWLPGRPGSEFNDLFSYDYPSNQYFVCCAMDMSADGHVILIADNELKVMRLDEDPPLRPRLDPVTPTYVYGCPTLVRFEVWAHTFFCEDQGEVDWFRIVPGHADPVPIPGYHGPLMLSGFNLRGDYFCTYHGMRSHLFHVGCVAAFNCGWQPSAWDIFGFFEAWFSGWEQADINLDGTLDLTDVHLFVQAWFDGCPDPNEP